MPTRKGILITPLPHRNFYVWRTKITTQTPRISKNVISTSSSLRLPRPFCTSPQYCFTGVSLTFSTGKQLVFIGGQNDLNRNFFIRKPLPGW